MKSDFEPVRLEQLRIKSLLQDIDYAVKKLEPQVRLVESALESQQTLSKLDMSKVTDRVEKVDVSVQSLRKQVSKIAEALSQGGIQAAPKIDLDKMYETGREDLDKLELKIEQIAQENFKVIQKMREDLEKKVSLGDLASVQANLLDKLNELMGNLEGMFADKDATRKKLAALEKAVSHILTAV